MNESKKLKVLQLNYSAKGGAGRVAATLSKLLNDSKQIESKFIFVTKKSLRENPFADFGTFFRSFTDNYIIKNKNFEGLFSYFRNKSKNKLIKKLLKFGGIIHLHWINGALSTNDIEHFVETGKNVVWTIHDLNPITGGCHTNVNCKNFFDLCNSCPAVKKKFQKLPLKLRKEVNKFWSNNKNIKIVFPSHSLKNIYLTNKFFKDIDSAVIPNPLRKEFYSNKYKYDRKKIKNFLCLGFISEDLNDLNKNFAFILELITNVQLANPTNKIRLYAIGQKYLHIPNDLNFELIQCGKIENEDNLIQIMCKFDILVSPSKFESFGLTVAEASWLGIPSLVFDTHAASEYLKEIDQILVAQNEYIYFENLLKLSKNDFLLKQLGQLCRNKAQSLFDESKITEQYIRLYLNL